MRKMRDSFKIQLSRRPKRETLAKSSFPDSQNARLSRNPAFQTPKMRDSRKIQLSRLSECETLAKSSFPDAQNACLFRNPLSGRLRNGGDPSRSKKVAQTELPESLSIRVRAHVFFSRNFRIQFDSRFDSRFDSFQTRKMRDSLKIQLSRRPKRETLAKSSFSDAQNARLFQNLAFQTFKMRASRKIQEFFEIDKNTDGVFASTKRSF